MHIHKVVYNWPAGGVGAIVERIISETEHLGLKFSFTFLSEPEADIQAPFFVLDYPETINYSALSYLKFAYHPLYGIKSKNLKEWIQFIENQQADIVHFHTLPRELRIATCLPKSLIKVFTDHSARFEKGQYKWYSQFFLQHAYSKFLKPFHTVSVSNQVSKYHKEFGILNPKKNHIQITNSVDSSALDHSKVNDSVEILAIYPARICDKKGHLCLLDAWKIFIEQGGKGKLMLAGNQEHNWDINYEIQERKLEETVNWLGQLNQEDYQKQLLSANLGVFPSEKEGLSVALLELMAFENPVIVNSIPELTDIVSSLEGYHYVKNDSESLANQLYSAFRNIEERKAKGAAAKRVIQQFYSHNLGECYKQFYEQLPPL